MPLTREDLEFYFDQLNGKVDGVNARLDTLNGKTNQNVTDIAILFDRAEQARSLAVTAASDAKTSGRNHGAIWGSIGAGALMLLDMAYKYLTHSAAP